MSNDIGPIPGSGTSADLKKKRGNGEAQKKDVRADSGDPLIKPNTGSESGGNKAQALANRPKSWPEIDCSKPHEEVEKTITECMKTKYGATLVTDMEDAQLLLSYVTRNGLQEDRKVSDETIQTLIASWQHLRAGVFDSEKEEPQFRKSYGILAKAAEPVTVVSLRDSTLITAPYRRWLVMEPEILPIAEIACRRYRKWAFLVLLLLLIAQIYWTVISSVLAKTEALISELNKAPSNAYYIDQENARRVAAAKPLGPSGPGSANAAQTVSVPVAPTETKADKTPPLTLDELRSKRAELEANYSMLDKFMRPFRKLYFHRDNTSPAKPETAQPNSGPETPAKADESIFVPSEFQNESASIRTVAGQLIDVMQKWLLPLLYGALGAMVFVVRTLSAQARDRLFRKEALVSLILRVFLGMISGLAIGWFWTSTPQTSSSGGPMSVSTLSPFALAFVAGYGVELFFALLDKIVSTFTNKS